MPKFRHRYPNHKLRFAIRLTPLIIVFITIMVGVTQLETIREFLSQASGDPADLRINTQAVLGPMPRPWRNLAQGGEEAAWRIQPISNQVRALNPEYIRIDHIYDFYEIVKATPGNLTFDFSKFDVILNDITATGAKPYIALSYMPPAISRGDIVDQPIRWEDWQLTVQKTIEHVSGTRGISDVYYEVWNEPDLFGGWKYYGEKNYLTLYDYAARGAARARNTRPYKFGGPGITALYKNWFDAMAKFAINTNTRLDFFSWHRYSADLEQYQKDMNEARTWLAGYPQLEPTLELHITEWGHDSKNHPGYDGNLGAAHTVAGSIEMTNFIQRAFVFEIQDGKDPQGNARWGRWGMLTHNEFGSTPKPRYQALRMLDRIADQRLQLTGKGSWVKALAARDAQQNVEVVLANYDRAGRNVENVPITFTNIEPGAYLVRKEFLGGRTQTEKVATSAAELRITVLMSANSVSFVELIKEAPTDVLNQVP